MINSNVESTVNLDLEFLDYELDNFPLELPFDNPYTEEQLKEMWIKLLEDIRTTI